MGGELNSVEDLPSLVFLRAGVGGDDDGDGTLLERKLGDMVEALKDKAPREYEYGYSDIQGRRCPGCGDVS